MIDTILQSLKSFLETPSFWYNLTAILLAAGSLLYGIIKDYVQSKKKEPVYWIRTTHMVRETIKDVKGLRILYNDVEVSDLSSTKFIFWNKGKDAIKQNDIASRNPIKITIDSEYEILDAFIDKCTDEDNNFSIVKQPDGKSILINFEFMEKSDGVSIKLTHTAPSSDKFKITGKVISGSKIEYARSASYNLLPLLLTREVKNPKREYLIFKSLVILGGLFFILISFSVYKEQDIISYIGRTFFLLLGIFYIYAAIFIIRKRIPEKLDLG